MIKGLYFYYVKRFIEMKEIISLMEKVGKGQEEFRGVYEKQLEIFQMKRCLILFVIKYM